MKKRILWLVVIATSFAGFYFFMIEPALEPPPPREPSPLADLRPALPPPPELPEIVVPAVDVPAIAPPVMATPPKRAAVMPIEVPIQDGATIDFSTGAPNVRSTGEDQAALERALKEMAEATKGITFPPAK